MKYIKSYKTFEGKSEDFIKFLLTKAELSSKWKDITSDIPELGVDAIRAFSYNYDKKYRLLLLFRKHNDATNPMLYLDDTENGTIDFIDRLDTPYYGDEYNIKQDPMKWCVRKGEVLYENYKEIDSLPKEDELRDTFQEIIDDWLDLEEVKYGQTQLGFPNDEYDREVFLDRNPSGKPIKCIMFFKNKYSRLHDDWEKDFEFCKERLLMQYQNVKCEMEYTGFDHVMITIQNK